MNVSLLEALAALRAVVGYLGEREQHSWWQSSFFSLSSRAFLTPVFARTPLLAQYNGVTRAATIIHDARIGIGDVFHLFRLPEDLEQGIHRVVHDARVAAQIEVVVRDYDAALAHLHVLLSSKGGGGVGPTRVGDTHDLRQEQSWQVVAGQYAQAFAAGTEIYPYFSDRAS